MALRATSPIAPQRKSAKVGDVVTFTAKVENTGAEDAQVSLVVEDLVEGALSKPVAFTFIFEPARVAVRAKSRAVVEYRWRAALPEGKDAHTFRGKLVLRAADGKDVGRAELDFYVGR